MKRVSCLVVLERVVESIILFGIQLVDKSLINQAIEDDY
jgi:hypothetical protein